ncbi:MAG TPA: PEGA domain-containing protein, partial [Spirochaetia bacterium]|nr:PEGA domain-containing protein [Spirochaetia bacterium]
MTTKCACALAALALAASVLLASCATSKGTTLGTVTAAEAGGAQATNPPSSPSLRPSPNPPTAKQGLEIVSDPDNAEVWIDGTFKGLSPYIAQDLSMGWHKITLHKTGYYETSGWVDFESDYMQYQASLVQMIGYLQVSVTPPDSVISVGGQTVSPGLNTLAVGDYSLLVRSFGFSDYQESITIQEKAVTTLAVTLQPAEFSITSFSVPKPGINPDNPGLLGVIDVNLSVTGPGTGQLQILNAGSVEVFSIALPEFTTWDQSFSWNVRDSSGNALPDGTYTLAVKAKGDGSEAEVERETTIQVDRTLKIAPR